MQKVRLHDTDLAGSIHSPLWWQHLLGNVLVNVHMNVYEVMQASHALFTHKVVARVLASVETSFDETNELSRFRPKLTQCMLTQMLPGPATSGAAVLVPRLLSVLKLMHLRNAVHATLRDQVRPPPVSCGILHFLQCYYTILFE